MNTYIHLSHEPKSEYINNGKTGVKELDKILPLLYKKFKIFQISAKIGEEQPNDGFSLEIKSHDHFQRFVFGIITVQFRIFTYTGKTEKHFAISSNREEPYHPEPVSLGYEAVGNDFEQVLTAFLMGTEKLLDNEISILEKYKNTLSKLHVGKYLKSKARFCMILEC